MILSLFLALKFQIYCSTLVENFIWLYFFYFFSPTIFYAILNRLLFIYIHTHSQYNLSFFSYAILSFFGCEFSAYFFSLFLFGSLFCCASKYSTFFSFVFSLLQIVKNIFFLVPLPLSLSLFLSNAWKLFIFVTVHVAAAATAIFVFISLTGILFVYLKLPVHYSIKYTLQNGYFPSE